MTSLRRAEREAEAETRQRHESWFMGAWDHEKGNPPAPLHHPEDYMTGYRGEDDPA